MNWVYIGGGDWELQGGPYLGCMYGSKFHDNYVLRLEQWNSNEQKWKGVYNEDTKVTGYAEAKAKMVEMYKVRLEQDLDSLKRL